jgi:hypothetical protein
MIKNGSYLPPLTSTRYPIIGKNGDKKTRVKKITIEFTSEK